MLTCYCTAYPTNIICQNNCQIELCQEKSGVKLLKKTRVSRKYLFNRISKFEWPLSLIVQLILVQFCSKKKSHLFLPDKVLLIFLMKREIFSFRLKPQIFTSFFLISIFFLFFISIFMASLLPRSKTRVKTRSLKFCSLERYLIPNQYFILFWIYFSQKYRNLFSVWKKLSLRF